jgi:parallel beta helix pectate lyase-like protein
MHTLKRHWNVVGLALIACAGVLALVLVGTAGAARATTVTCGGAYTSDIALTSDLDCRGLDGVHIVGATFDLNGFTIFGDGTGTGVIVGGKAVVEGGTVLRFGEGIRILRGDDSTVTSMRVTENTGDGVVNDTGLRNTVRHSRIDHNGGDGIAAFGQADAATYSFNKVDHNGGFGIIIDSSISAVIGNISSFNHQTGIDLFDTYPFGPGYLIAHNRADSNGGFGIRACVVIPGHNPCAPLMRDGGGNHAQGNREDPQCINIVCEP